MKIKQIENLQSKYPWLRIEHQYNNDIACGGIFPIKEIKIGQEWQSGSHKVVINHVDENKIGYQWFEKGSKKENSKTPTAFQSRYCLIVSHFTKHSKCPWCGSRFEVESEPCPALAIDDPDKIWFLCCTHCGSESPPQRTQLDALNLLPEPEKSEEKERLFPE